MTEGPSLRGKDIVRRSILLAEELLASSSHHIKAKERRVLKLLARMMSDPKGKAFTAALSDRAFRSSSSSKAVPKLQKLIHTHGIPQYLGPIERAHLWLFQHCAQHLPQTAMNGVLAKMNEEMSSVIIDSEPSLLNQHLNKRSEQKLHVNCNRLGEAILGEQEAQRRIEQYCEDLQNPNVEYISVKVSSIASNIQPLAWEKTLDRLKPRLRKLYRLAQQNPFEGKPKFVNLDMEEYRDLNLTHELFTSILNEEEFFSLKAGIALQAYLPDAHQVQKKLTQWAQERTEKGGSPIKMRLVKGANLSMEQLEAEIRGWPLATYDNKRDVDANYKRMLEFACQAEHARAVNIGVASHNLFDIAFAMILDEEMDLNGLMSFEMLEGMAPQQRRQLQSYNKNILLYAPIAAKGDFSSAMAYLIRRLEENTAPGNFLRDNFGLSIESKAWERHRAAFAASWRSRHQVSSEPKRQQNRCRDHNHQYHSSHRQFCNEPDTDFTLQANRDWIQALMKTAKSEQGLKVAVQVAGEDHFDGLEQGHGEDPSQPGHKAYGFAKASADLLELALDASSKSASTWASSDLKERRQLLLNIANQLRHQRGQLIVTLIKDAAKTIAEADTEVSEAIDFAEHYARAFDQPWAPPYRALDPLGTVLVTPPWNFPLAIAAGGVFAALMAGNAVILKAAPQTVLTARRLAECCWRGGVPQTLLQFISCDDEPSGSKLIQDPRIKAVILTGASATARHFKNIRPELPLFAETGGKNSIYISSMSDHDLAIRDSLSSAFSHAGQKCSACSLLILEGELYDNHHFLDKLVDAAASLPLGSAWEPDTIIPPLIEEPRGALKKAIETLDDGERWLLKPSCDVDKPRRCSPGIKIGVRPGSWSHQTEFFGPLLSIIRADDIDEAIAIANGTAYGLTAGIHSLDEAEQKMWTDQVHAGNLYVNRPITGAIVNRQAFGGRKDSSFGPGAKAGGPNYVFQFCQLSNMTSNSMSHGSFELSSAEQDFWRQKLEPWEEQLSADEMARLKNTLLKVDETWTDEFSKTQDLTDFKTQQNLLRYRPLKTLFRITAQTPVMWFLGALICGRYQLRNCHISLDKHAPSSWQRLLCHLAPTHLHHEDDFHGEIGRFENLRLFEDASAQVLKLANQNNTHLSLGAPLSHVRSETSRYLWEQCISIDVHRYGHVAEV